MEKIEKKITELLQSHLSPNLSWDDGLVHSSAYGRLKLNGDGLNAKGKIYPFGMNYNLMLGDDSSLNIDGNINPLKLYYNLMLNEGGDYNLNLRRPLGTGNIDFNASSNNDINRYSLGYRVNW